MVVLHHVESDVRPGRGCGHVALARGQRHDGVRPATGCAPAATGAGGPLLLSGGLPVQSSRATPQRPGASADAGGRPQRARRSWSPRARPLVGGRAPPRCPAADRPGRAPAVRRGHGQPRRAQGLHPGTVAAFESVTDDHAFSGGVCPNPSHGAARPIRPATRRVQPTATGRTPRPPPPRGGLAAAPPPPAAVPPSRSRPPAPAVLVRLAPDASPVALAFWRTAAVALLLAPSLPRRRPQPSRCPGPRPR